METKILRITQINLDEQFYPRMKYNWFTANDYKHSMKSGAIFPPIEVALFNNKYYLIDGRHRIEANKLLKEENIQVNIHTGLTPSQIFAMAVETNIKHGRPLSSQDKALVIDKLEKLKFSLSDISKLVNIPEDKIEIFKTQRITNTVSGETIYLKATTKNYAGIEVPEDFNEQQDGFSTRGQIQLMLQVIQLIERGMWDMNNTNIIKLMIKLKSLVKSLKIPLKVKN